MAQGLIEMVKLAEKNNYAPAESTKARGKGALVLSACPHCGGNRKSRVLFVNKKRASKKRPKTLWKCHVCGKAERPAK